MDTGVRWDPELSGPTLFDRVAAMDGVIAAAVDRDLYVVEDSGPLDASRFRRATHVGLPLAQAFGIEDSGELEQACRRAFGGEQLTIHCEAAALSERFQVRLAPPIEGDDRVVTLWTVLDAGGDELERERERGHELHQLWLACRSLARADGFEEIRRSICEAAGLLAGCRASALLEPRGESGELEVTASEGCPDQLPTLPSTELSGPTLAMRTGSQVTTAPGERLAPAAEALRAASGVESVIWQPICRGRAVDAVLMVGFGGGDPPPGLRENRLIETLAVEASIALERERRLERSVEQANSDPLTGLPNRRVLEVALPRELARAERRCEPMCLALLDLDRFKEFNDAYGHRRGDELLAGLSRRWEPCLRASDVLLRYGGDEFVVLFPDCSLEDGQGILERMRGVGEYSFSAGLASYDGAEEPEDLLERADQALYRAKGAGGATISI